MAEEIVEVTLEDGRVITVRQKPVEPQRDDPVRDARTIEELQALIDNEIEHPDLAIRASQRITELVAAQMTQRAEPLFTQVRVGNETVMLDRHDCRTLRSQYVAAQQAVIGCKKHERSIKCACLASWREWYYALQRQAPNSPLALASQNLWDLVERFSQEYERPKEYPELRAIVEAIGTQNNGEVDPEWFGRRSERGINKQKQNAERRRKHDFR